MSKPTTDHVLYGPAAHDDVADGAQSLAEFFHNRLAQQKDFVTLVGRQ